MSSSPVALKTRRVRQRCTLNLLRAETSSRWCEGIYKGGARSEKRVTCNQQLRKSTRLQTIIEKGGVIGNDGNKEKSRSVSNYQCCVKGILGTGGVMDKCVQMLDKELWRLGPDGSGEGRRREREKRKKERREETEKEREGDGKREEKESGRERGARLVWRKGLSLRLEWKDDERRWR
ncbi:hypothetical protein TNCV_3826371 [Trichonephila clavipes]|nr:hypothetical protein TNCV_3826371 [Trichonephila clavipes]